MTALDDAPTTQRGAWVRVCRLDDLTVGRGVAALVGPTQVAVFRLSADAADPRLRAVDNIDPFGRAAVISRGIVGDRNGVPTVASPLLKQVFSLDSGECLDDETVALNTYPVRVVDGVVEVCANR
ncbi:nitrite reductase small subunit NirD [Gordonia sp. NPDC003429]